MIIEVMFLRLTIGDESGLEASCHPMLSRHDPVSSHTEHDPLIFHPRLGQYLTNFVEELYMCPLDIKYSVEYNSK